MSKNLLLFLTCCLTSLVLQAQTPTLQFSYNEATGTTTAVEAVSGNTFPVRNNFNRPERVTGIAGNALRLDGFSTWVEVASAYNYRKAFTVETWVNLESYPSDAEVPYASLVPSAIVSQFFGTSGFQLGMNTFGKWFFRANISGVNYTCHATELFPLYKWVHVAAVMDGDAGSIKLYLNGEEKGAVSFPAGGELHEANVPLFIGKSNTDKRDGIFLLNALNAAIDETKFYDAALTKATLQNHYQAGAAQAATLGTASLEVPDARFAQDLQRPVYHSMPPANWANEPHGLVKHNGQYHMFYQRTPNGPFKTQMHWGHMVSKDLVNWHHLQDALWPTLEWSPTSGYDMKGIWSGDVIMHNNKAYAFYTNVNHSGSYNPGIALATSSDPNLETWEKHGPVISRENVNDFRDPFIWKEGSTWHMLIGAALGSGGGLAYYTSSDLLNWTFTPNFTSIPYSQMDIGSAIWEMPVFEPLGNGKYVLVVNPIGGTVGKYGPSLYTRAVYWTGTWQNGRFTPDYSQPKMLDLIHGHLSPTIERDYNNNIVGIGIVDERRSSQAQLNAGWAHLFSLPRVWYLLPDGKTLGQKPLPDMANIRQTSGYQKYSDIQVTATTPVNNIGGKSTEIIAYIDTTSTGTRYGLNFRVSPNRQEITSLYYDTQLKKVLLNKSQSSLSNQDEEKRLLEGAYDEKAFGKPYKFHVFIDHSVVDVFINDAAAFSFRIYPTLDQSEGVELYSQGGSTLFSSVEGWGVAQAVPDATKGESKATYLRYDFELGHLSDLIVTGDAFSAANITTENTWSSGGPFNQQGLRHLRGGRNGGDARTGELRTPDFTLGGDGQISFLLGGGNNPDQLYVALVRASDNQVLLQVSGKNQEAYQREVMNASQYIGTRSYLKMVDQATGNFGYLNIDDIRVPVAIPVTGLVLEKESLNLPVNTKTTLFAVVQPADATNAAVTWSSSNPDVARVDAAGEVTAVATGHTVITATTEDGAFTAETAIAVTGGVHTSYLRYDFEQGGFGDLVVTGQAFTTSDITTDINWGWGGPFNQQGQRHLWGHKAGGDTRTGEMRTPDFVLGGDGKITFLLGGGKNLNTLYVALVRASDNQVLMKTTGLNDEAYAPKVFEAGDYVGTTCYIRIVDSETGGFGHLNIDNLVIPVNSAVTGLGRGKAGEELNQSISLYPVPVKDSFFLDLSVLNNEDVLVEMLDMQGRILHGRIVRAGATVNIGVRNILKSGQLYLVKITSVQGSFTKKILLL